jgi:PAS domain S-box-containing protein
MADRSGSRAELMIEGTRQILLVEDDQTHANLISRVFAAQNIPVNLTVARSLKEARAQLATSIPDLLLVDFWLPDGNGLDLLAGNTEPTPYPVIIITGHSDERTAVEVIRAGALDYVTKSEASLQTLPRIVDRALDLWENMVERKRVEEALWRTAKRFQSLIENSNDIMMMIEPNGVFRYSSPSMARILEYVSEYVVGKSIFDFIHPEDTATLKSTIQQALNQAGVSLPEIEYRIRHKDGPWRTFAATVTNLLNEPSVGSLLLNSHDVTQRKRAEEELRQRNRELSLLNQIIAVSAATSSAEPEVLLETACRELALAFNVPHAAAVLLNPQKTEALVVAEFSDNRQASVLNASISIVDNPAFQFLLTHKAPLVTADKDKDFRFTEASHALWGQAAKSLMLLPVMVQDELVGGLALASLQPRQFSTQEIDLAWRVAEQVSSALARTRLDEERRQLETRYQQAQKMETIGTLAGGIAHDFNNILQAIFGYTEMARRRRSIDEKALADLDQVAQAAERARDLVSQILTFSRQGKQERVPVQIQLIIKEALKLLRASLPTTIEIRHEIDNTCGLVLADPSQIHQVIMNLCTNAYHAMREQGGLLSVSLTPLEVDVDFVRRHPAMKVGHYVTLTVSDTGHGMDQALIKRIFEPFFTTKDVGEGTGLGLSVVHGIVIQHGGEITVESEQGNGTIFNVYLPCVQAGVTHDAATEAMISKGQGHILFIDDEEAITLMGKMMLQDLGYQVTITTNSLNALELFRDTPYEYDLIITDQTMAHMTGIQLASEMMKIRPNINVVLITGYSEQVTSEQAKQAGIQEYLMKPFNISDLSTAIHRVLGKTAEKSKLGSQATSR